MGEVADHFHSRLPRVRLALACLVSGFLGYMLSLEKRSDLRFLNERGEPPTAGFYTGAAGVGLILPAGWGSIVSFLTLPSRLKFTEEGLRRRPLFPPYFLPWRDVKGASPGHYKGYEMLDLWVSRRRWVTAPVDEYREKARLLEELSRRLLVEVRGLRREGTTG